jgi:cytochrome c oxidase subunit II
MSKYNMPVGVTPISQDIYDLHMAVFWICVAIGVVVFSVMIYALIMHRKSRGVTPSQFHEHPGLEITWAVIPFILLIIMAIPATLVLMKMEDTKDADMTVKVTGYQWKWKYEYLDHGISFFSNLSTPPEQIQNKAPKEEHYLLEVDNPVVVPINKKVRFVVTSHDVIHSWWVPELGVKRDAIPGFIHESWATIEKPGTYRGQCAELCGVNHGYMPIVVVAKTQEDFDSWLKEQDALKTDKDSAIKSIPKFKPKTWTKEELMVRGEKAYNLTCAVCHKKDGVGQPPAFPALKGSKIVNGPIKANIDQVMNGKPGTAMQAFGEQLSDEDIAAIITYQRNSWGNNTGDVIQPADIKAARK